VIIKQRGESLLLTRKLQQSDGSPLSIADVLAITCELRQANAVVETLELGSDNRLRAHDTQASWLLLELTAETTAALAKGQLTERYTMLLTSADYVAQSGERTVKLDITEVQLT
jgi:hypothetical protein